jgi:alpha-N-arabinofuranosidase
LKLIGSGPNGGDVNWTRKFFEGLALKGGRQIAKLYGWGLHYYCGSTGQQIANEYTENEWYDFWNARTEWNHSLKTTGR